MKKNLLNKKPLGFLFGATRRIEAVGFTLIELLISVVILSILSGVTMSAINVGMQRKRAEDGVKRSNLEKLYIGIEAYKAAEGSYPTCASPPCSTLTDLGALSDYVKLWPNLTPAGATYYYVSNGTTRFCVYVALSVDSTKYYKYDSGIGKIDSVTTTTCP